MKFRIWLKETDPFPVVIEAEDVQDAHMRVEQLLNEGALWDEVSVELPEDCLKVDSVEPVEE